MRQFLLVTALCLLLPAFTAHARQYGSLPDAALYGTPDDVKMFLKKGFKINRLDKQGYTPLHYAAMNERPETAAALLEMGADINLPSRSGDLPLEIAIEHNRPENVRLFIKRGANINTAKKGHMTPLHFALSRNSRMVPLLLNLGGDVNARLDRDDLSWTLLHSAATNNNLAKAKMLISHGADVNALDDAGRTPLMSSLHYNEHSRDMVRLLIENGAKADLEVYLNPHYQTRFSRNLYCITLPIAYLGAAAYLREGSGDDSGGSGNFARVNGVVGGATAGGILGALALYAIFRDNFRSNHTGPAIFGELMIYTGAIAGAILGGTLSWMKRDSFNDNRALHYGAAAATASIPILVYHFNY